MKTKDNSLNPLNGLKNEFPETRKSYAFVLAFKSFYASQKTQSFIQSIKTQIASSIIESFETFKCPKLPNYMYLYQCLANYMIEPLKKYRCNYSMNYFESIMSLLHLYHDINYIITIKIN